MILQEGSQKKLEEILEQLAFDLDHTEADIKVEERDGDELRYFKGIKNAPPGVNVINFAFDATPLELISAIITEKGIVYPPFWD